MITTYYVHYLDSLVMKRKNIPLECSESWTGGHVHLLAGRTAIIR